MTRYFIVLTLLIYIGQISIRNNLTNSSESNYNKGLSNDLTFHSSALTYEIHTPILIQNDGDFASYNFSGSGTRENPYLIEGYNITKHGFLTMAIDISNTHSFFIITHCVIYAEYIGIGLDNVQSGTSIIRNNKFYSLIGDGGAITILNMQNCTIEGNTGTNFMQGIHLNGADNNIIYNNYFYNINNQGINIRDSNSNNITYNRIKNSKEHGIALVVGSSNNLLHHNIIEGCAWANSYNIDGTQYNIKPTSQGYDDGFNNLWYDPKEKFGNTWSDYFGIGSYQIDGHSNSIDLYPKHSTGFSPFIIIITSISITSGVVVLLLFYRFYIKRKKS